MLLSMSTEEILTSNVSHTNSRNKFRVIAPKIFQFLRYWPLYLVCLCFSLSAAFFYLRYKGPVYIVTANLENYGLALPLKLDGAVRDDSGTIKLRSAILEVVKKLNLTVRYQKKGRLVNRDLYKDSPVKFQLVRMGTPGLHNFELSIKNKDTYLLKKGSANAGEFAFNQIYTSEIGSWLISKNPAFNKFIDQTIVIQVQDPETVTEKLFSNILVSPDEFDSKITRFAITDQVRDKGEAILSQLISQLNSTLAQEKAIESAMDTRLVDQSLLAFGDQVDALQTELNVLSDAERNAELSSISTNYLKAAKNTGIALNAISFELMALTDLGAYIKNQDLNTVPPTSASGFSDPALNEFVRQLIVLQLQSRRLLETHLENDPIFDTLKQQTAKIKISMSKSVISLKSALLKRQADLESFDKRAQSSLNPLPARERRLVGLKRKQITYENQYAFLLKRKEEVSLKRASSSYANEFPDTSYKVDLTKKTIYTWAFLCGLLIPSVIVAGRSINSLKKQS